MEKAGMKVIRKFNFDTKNISQNGEVRKFSIISDRLAVFSLEILNEDSHYYNFKTKTFTADKHKIDNHIIVNGLYKGEVVFPAVTDDDHYDIRLWAPDIYNTKHVDYIEVRNEDDSINLNASSGSNSNLLAKKIFQYSDIGVTISVNTGITGSDWGAITAGTQVINGSLLGTSKKKHSFSITGTVAGDKGIAITRQPTAADVYSVSSRQYGTAVQVPGEDLYSDIRGKTKTTGGGAMDEIPIRASYTDLGLIVGDAVVVGGYTMESSPLLTIAATAVGGDPHVIRLSEAVTYADQDDISFYYNGYHRWNIHASSSLHGLTAGMAIVGTNGITPYVKLGDYNEKLKERDVERFKKKLEKSLENGGELPLEFKKAFEEGFRFPAIVKSTKKPTYTSGVVSKQLGIITHANQQTVASANQSFNAFAYGRKQISSLTYCDAVFTNLNVSLTKVTTNTSSAISNANLAVDDRSGAINNVTRVKAIGIDGTSGYPLITSGAGADGAGTLVMSSSQNIEDDQVVEFLGTGSVVTITGDVEFKRFPVANTTLFFDASTFLLTN